ncbi:MAG TPA: GlsB/YeaQ/YmgE family stress response membrane protein [Actinomycetota bacterium]|nr:GlsB/YeaQ/YmgE family stress response membrane protein [Actinomycetota bacterium]
MLILAIIVLGMAAGWVAQMILGRGTGNWGEALVAGLIGSFVGGLLFSLLSGDGLRLRPSGIIGTIVGAIVVLAIWGAVRGRSRGRT